jgi:hypothetical protein
MLGDAVMGALTRASAALSQAQVPLALMGGVAVSIWKHARATKDVDLLVGLQTEEVPQLLRQLSISGIHPKRLPPVIEIDDVHIVPLTCQPTETLLDIRIDLLLAESAFQKQALDRAIPAELPPPNEAIRVLTCEDLLLFKLLAGRIIDRADAAYLLRENRKDLDFAHLNRWSRTLAIESNFQEIWKEAFPDEQPPFVSTIA